MKKLYLVFTLFICFFVFSFNVKADSNVYGVNLSDGSLDGSAKKILPWQSTEIFNYFKEERENTEFYQLLKYVGYDIENYLLSLSNSSRKSDLEYLDVLIFTVSEMEYFNAINENQYSIPDGATHAILLFETGDVYPYSFDVLNNSLVPHFFFRRGSFRLYWFNGFNYISSISDYSSNYYSSPFNDTNTAFLRFISKYEFSYNWLSSGFWIFKDKQYDGSDFGYLYSKFYKTNNLGISFHGDVPNSSKITLISNNFVYNNNVTSDMQQSIVSKFGLDYLQENPIISLDIPFKPLLNLMYINSGKNIPPSNYSVADFTLSSNISLYPKKKCSVKENNFYVYSNTKDSFKLYYHSIGEDDTFGYRSTYYSTFKTEKMGNIVINPLLKVYDLTTSDVVELSENDFIKYSYRFQANDNKYVHRVYYNPDCYKLQINNESIQYTNPNSGNTVTIDGGNSNVWSDPENINDANTEKFDFGFSSLVSTLKGVTSTFVDAAGYIVSLSTTLLGNLPVEIQSVFIFVFVISALVIVLKIFTGIL